MLKQVDEQVYNLDMEREALPFEERIVLHHWRNNVAVDTYRELHENTLTPEFWEEVASELEWFSPWSKTIDDSNPPFYRWFLDGKLNMSYLCLDRHVSTWRRNKVALIWEGENYEVRKLTYLDLYKEVNRFAKLLRDRFGIRKGDRVGIYMPMVPELVVSMLALSRIGAIFTVVFSGFSAQALSQRLNDAQAKLLITADAFYRRGKVVELKRTADQALQTSQSVRNVIVFRRMDGLEVPMKESRDFWYHEIMEEVPMDTYVEPEPVSSQDPLFILYTSGTTGKPKGIVHDTGGYAVIVHATMKWVFDANDKDIYWCAADVGWITGHSYIVFGPLMHGLTSIMYEGAPDHPHPGRWWEIIEKYSVSVFYTSPTAIRALMKAGDEYVQRYDLSSLRILHSVGEPINPSAWRWFFEKVGMGRCPTGSTWWMTETGGIMISHLPGIALVPLKPGTNGFPIFGVSANVYREDGSVAKPGEKGYLVIEKPWPGMPLTIHGDPQRYIDTYWKKFEGVFYAGDFALKDEDGYIWVLGRADEVMNVAGHRLGTYEIESAIVSHQAVAESAVVSIPDEVKGEVPVAFVVLKEGYEPSESLRQEIAGKVIERIGKIAVPKRIIFVSKLPKTRSGKIMRRLLRAVITNRELGDVSTLEDSASVEEVKRAYEELRREMDG